MVSIKEALEIIEKNIKAVGREIIPIEEGVNRVIARDYIANYDLPRFNNSAMDGFAVRVADSGKIVRVDGVIYAEIE